MAKLWYVAKTGNQQGLVVEEDSGRNVAVAYDKGDATLLASAPRMLDVLKEIAVVEGPVTISNGVLCFADGTSVNLYQLIDEVEA